MVGSGHVNVNDHSHAHGHDSSNSQTNEADVTIMDAFECRKIADTFGNTQFTGKKLNQHNKLLQPGACIMLKPGNEEKLNL